MKLTLVCQITEPILPLYIIVNIRFKVIIFNFEKVWKGIDGPSEGTPMISGAVRWYSRAQGYYLRVDIQDFEPLG